MNRWNPIKAKSAALAVDKHPNILMPEQDEAMLREAGFSDVNLFYAVFAFRSRSHHVAIATARRLHDTSAFLTSSATVIGCARARFRKPMVDSNALVISVSEPSKLKETRFFLTASLDSNGKGHVLSLQVHGTDDYHHFRCLTTLAMWTMQ